MAMPRVPRSDPAAAAAPRAAAPHTVASPDAPAEPVAETRAAAPTRKHRLNTACTFVIAPGASGANFCYELTECLRRLGHATEVERWHSAYSKDIKRNADRLERFAKEAAAASGPGCRVLLVGDGYGGRVVAHLLARWAAGEPPPANVFADAALLVGYQLYGAAPPRNSGDDRLALLQALPASTRLLFVSGEKDEFLDRTKGGTAWRDVSSARGVAALRAAAADLPCAAHATVVGIFVEINQCVGCTRQFFIKSSLGDDAAVPAPSSGGESAPPRYRAGVASMSWRTTRRFSTNAP